MNQNQVTPNSKFQHGDGFMKLLIVTEQGEDHKPRYFFKHIVEASDRQVTVRQERLSCRPQMLSGGIFSLLVGFSILKVLSNRHTDVRSHTEGSAIHGTTTPQQFGSGLLTSQPLHITDILINQPF